jgi:hypothetical protein
MNPNGNILIFTPTWNLRPNPHEYQASLIKMFHQIQALQMGFAYLPVYRRPWIEANNICWDAAFGQGFEYILRFDDDVHDVPDDAIKKLIEAKKDVIGASYPLRRWPYFTAAMNRKEDKSLIDIYMEGLNLLRCIGLPEKVNEDEDIEVCPCDQVGFGLTLIKTERFKELSRPIFGNYDADVPDDTIFAQLCLDNKIQQYVHFGVKCAHDFVNYKNNLALFQAGLGERVAEAQANGRDIPKTNYDMQEFTDEQAVFSAIRLEE